MELSQEYIIAILSILLAVSELIALNPKYKSNSVLQLVRNILKKLIGKKEEEPEKKIERIAEEAIIDAIVEEVEKELKKKD